MPGLVFVTGVASGLYKGSLLPVFYGNKFLKVGNLQKGIKLEMITLQSGITIALLVVIFL